MSLPLAENVQDIIQEYPEDYCLYLEGTYSPGYMSEGGDVATAQLLQGLDLAGKRVLEIGSGLGGAAFYVASQGAKVTGLEINARLVELATERIPAHLRNNVDFATYETRIPFDDQVFDLIFSKGVLTHVSDKLPLFKEFHRVLKPGGQLAINDWLSSKQGQFGPLVEEMCRIDGLTLFAHTPAHYQDVLTKSGFSLLSSRDLTHDYADYNAELVRNLLLPEGKKRFLDKGYSEEEWQQAVHGYTLIEKFMKEREVLVFDFRVIRP